jgi:transglutaminase-like putative cysteine protease
MELAGAARFRPTSGAASTVCLNQRVRYEYDWPVRNVRQRLILVPRGRHGSQHRLTWTVALDGVSTASAVPRRDRFGNHVLDVHLPRVTDHVEFVVSSTIEMRPSGEAHRERLDIRYSRPSRLTAADDSLGALVDGSPAITASEICARVHEAFTYEWGVTGVRTTAMEALAVRRGVCQDYAHVMLAACRRAGIPARYVSGHLHGEGGSHAWVEVLEPDEDGTSCCVVAWDPTHNRRTHDGYLTIAVGRDYLDVAPVSGTYDAARRTRGRLTVDKRVELA